MTKRLIRFILLYCYRYTSVKGTTFFRVVGSDRLGVTVAEGSYQFWFTAERDELAFDRLRTGL